jgi:hypothetical protein
VPGSARVVGALLEHYCADGKGDVSDVIRNPDLPAHIRVHEHDVASAFKRLLGAIPGGILGSHAVFDVLASVRIRLEQRRPADASRLIALAIGSIASLHRRDLVCAVFGLLALVGDVAEAAAVQADLDGRPRADHDLMGYQALGVVFGPLLVGGLLQDQLVAAMGGGPGGVGTPNHHAAATPASGRKARARSRARQPETPTATPAAANNSLALAKRVLETNKVAQMMVAHWREVVLHLNVLGVYRGAPAVAMEGAAASQAVDDEKAAIPEVPRLPIAAEMLLHPAMTAPVFATPTAMRHGKATGGLAAPGGLDMSEYPPDADSDTEVQMGGGLNVSMGPPRPGHKRQDSRKVENRPTTSGSMVNGDADELMPMKRLRPRGSVRASEALGARGRQGYARASERPSADDENWPLAGAHQTQHQPSRAEDWPLPLSRPTSGEMDWPLMTTTTATQSRPTSGADSGWPLANNMPRVSEDSYDDGSVVRAGSPRLSNDGSIIRVSHDNGGPRFSTDGSVVRTGSPRVSNDLGSDSGSVIITDMSRETSIDSILSSARDGQHRQQQQQLHYPQQHLHPQSTMTAGPPRYDVRGGSGWRASNDSQRSMATTGGPPPRAGAEFTRPELATRAAAELSRRPSHADLFGVGAVRSSEELEQQQQQQYQQLDDGTWSRGSPRSSRIPRAVHQKSFDEPESPVVAKPHAHSHSTSAGSGFSSPWGALKRKMSRPRLVDREGDKVQQQHQHQQHLHQMPSLAGTS